VRDGRGAAPASNPPQRVAAGSCTFLTAGRKRPVLLSSDG